MKSIQIEKILADLETQFPGYYPTDYWNNGVLLDTITSLAGSTYFNLTTGKLFTYTVDWDAGATLPISEPVAPVDNDQWFNENTEKVHTYNVISDGGTVIPTTQLVAPFLAGAQWFDKTINTLYTSVTDDTWVGATTLVVSTTIPDPLTDGVWFDETIDTFYVLTGSWDAGVLTDTITEVTNSRYFDETKDRLYSYANSVWTYIAEVPVEEFTGAEDGDIYFDETLDLLHTYIDVGWLDLEEINSIVLKSNESIYPDDGIQINFDTSDELMYIRDGSWINEVFVPNRITAVVTFENILGIIMIRDPFRKSPYQIGKSV